MNANEKLLKELETAIDVMDMEAIDSGIHALTAIASHNIEAEDVTVFSSRIKQLDKERKTMNKSTKTIRTAVIIAAVVAAMGITAYASGITKYFSFGQDDKFYAIRTTDDMTEQEARDFIQDSENVEVTPEMLEQYAAEGITTEPEEFTFDTVQEAEAGMDMKLIMPSSMPEMNLDSITANQFDFGASISKTVWMDYSDDQERMFGVTISQEIILPGGDVTSYTRSDMDEGSLGSYKSKSGIEYTTLNESNEDGSMTANIAFVNAGEYEYALVFVGFDQAEREGIIDSVDITPYM